MDPPAECAEVEISLDSRQDATVVSWDKSTHGMKDKGSSSSRMKVKVPTTISTTRQTIPAAAIAEKPDRRLRRRLYMSIIVLFLLIAVIVGVVVLVLPSSKSRSSVASAATTVDSDSTAGTPVFAPPNFPPMDAPPAATPVEDVFNITTTESPVGSPTSTPTSQPTDVSETIFYAIGDVPYSEDEADGLRKQMLEDIPTDGLFVVHVGDIRKAKGKKECEKWEFEEVRDILKLSPIPVLLLHGDNEYNDCENFEEAQEFWHDVFGDMLDHWDHSLNLVHQPGREENFVLRDGTTLFIGLNIVGGDVHDSDEWEERLSSQWEWFEAQVDHHRSRFGRSGYVVLMAHADPNWRHDTFFDPLHDYFDDDDAPPLLYVHGDQHFWKFDRHEYGDDTWRMQLTGGVSEPPVKIHMFGDDFDYYR